MLLLGDSRVPSTALFLFGNTSFKVVQYNGRGALLADQYTVAILAQGFGSKQPLALCAALALRRVGSHHGPTLGSQPCTGTGAEASRRL